MRKVSQHLRRTAGLCAIALASLCAVPSHGSGNETTDKGSLYSDTIPYVRWQKVLGGVYTDGLLSVIKSSDGNCVLAGYSEVNGKASPLMNCWVMKINPHDGSVIWETNFGSADKIDAAFSIAEGHDGSYVVAGVDQSSVYFVEDRMMEPSNTTCNYKVAKLNPSNGATVWEKNFSGSSGDVAYSVTVCSDGDYLVAGTSLSTDGDFQKDSVSSYDSDGWLMKIAAETGDVLWKKNLGGSSADLIYSAIEDNNQEYVVSGHMYVQLADSVGYGGYIAKINPADSIPVWQNFYPYHTGEHSTKQIFYSVIQDAEGNYVAVGTQVYSDAYENAKILKIAPDGTTLWNKTISDSPFQDYVFRPLYSAIQSSDGNYVLVGATLVVDYSQNREDYDAWIVKISAVDGSIIWQKFIDIPVHNEAARSIIENGEGNYIVAGVIYYASGIEPTDRGDADGWIINLTEESLVSTRDTPQELLARPAVSVSPNPVVGPTFVATINVPSSATDYLSLVNMFGSEVYRTQLNESIAPVRAEIPSSGLPAGIYLLRLHTSAGSHTQKIVIQR